MGNYWFATRNPAPVTMSFSEPARVDVAVVGAGITGLTAALRLAEKGASVAVLEAEEAGWGASGRNAGFVVPNFAKVDPDRVVEKLGPERGEKLIGMIGGAANAVFEVIRRYDIACDGRQAGWFQPAHTMAAFDGLKKRAEQWARRGKVVQVLDAGEIAAASGCRLYRGAWMDPEGGTIHPVNYVTGLAQAAVTKRIALHPLSRVRRAERVNGAWQLTANGVTLTADKVLLCTNAYGGLFGRLQRSLIPLTVHQLATAPLPESVRSRLLRPGQCLSDVRNDLFTYRLTADNRLISGGMAAIGWGAAARMARHIAGRLTEMLDLTEVPQVDFIWSGRAAVTQDFLPKLHELAPGLIAGIGCNGRGIAMTTVLGPMLADFALGRPEADLPIPLTRPRPLPFHAIAGQASRAYVVWGRRADARALASDCRGSSSASRSS